MLVLLSMPMVAQHHPQSAAPNKPRAHSYDPVLATGGVAQGNSTAAAAELDSKVNIITIRYHCSAQTDKGQCTAMVSKQEFDALVQALDPKMPASARQSLAAEYARLLIMAAEARGRGMEHSAEVEALLKFSALQVLATRLVREISTPKATITDAQVEKHFRGHASDYKDLTLSRLLVPAAEPPGREPAAARADALRERAVKGEDFADLQREIAVGQSEAAKPTVRIGPIPCRTLPETHRPVCALKPGEVSMPLADGSGYSIYRVESVYSRGLEEVREDIRTELERQRVHEELAKVRNPVSLELDERYFGKLPNPDLVHEHGLHDPAIKTLMPPQSTSHSHDHRH